MELKKILVPIDFTEITQAVIDSAKFFGKNFGSKLYILHVLEKPHLLFYEEGAELLLSSDEYETLLKVEKEAEQKMLEKLQELSNNLKNEGIENEIILQTGEVVDTILDVADEKDIDFTILGSHKHGLLDMLLLGSTAEMVIQKSNRSVLVIKGQPISSISKIVCGYDFLPNSQEALDVAKILAKKFHAEIRIVHGDTDEGFAHSKSVYQSVLEKKIKLLDQLKEKLENEEHIKVSVEIIKKDPETAILETIEEFKPDIAILGRRKTSKVKRMFLGTTASKVVRNSPVPVMLVRRKDWGFRFYLYR